MVSITAGAYGFVISQHGQRESVGDRVCEWLSEEVCKRASECVREGGREAAC